MSFAFLGENLDDEQVETLFADCMDPEDDEGMIPYSRKYKLTISFVSPIFWIYMWCQFVNVKHIVICILYMHLLSTHTPHTHTHTQSQPAHHTPVYSNVLSVYSLAHATHAPPRTCRLCRMPHCVTDPIEFIQRLMSDPVVFD